ncbi:unnamed protein product [Tenebrio molitor]|nr:unnamed protein product [Tenebrio molitor]
MTLEARFKHEEIIPDVIDQAPESTVRVIFGGSHEVSLGNELTPTQVKAPPMLSWSAEEGAFYTVVFTDPDAPSRANPIRREFLHWLIGNVPGSDLSEGEVGEVIAEYAGSGPPQGTGLHRYIFLVFEQKDRMEFDEPKSEKGSRANRIKWSMRGFMKKNNLRKAFAGNYYVAQWDAYVDERRKQMRD